MSHLHDVPVNNIYKAIVESESTRWDEVHREQEYYCVPELYGDIPKTGQYQGEIDILAKDFDEELVYILEVKSDYSENDTIRMKNKAGKQLKKALNHFEAQGWAVMPFLLLNGHQERESYSLDELQEEMDIPEPEVKPINPVGAD